MFSAIRFAASLIGSATWLLACGACAQPVADAAGPAQAAASASASAVTATAPAVPLALVAPVAASAPAAARPAWGVGFEQRERLRGQSSGAMGPAAGERPMWGMRPAGGSRGPGRRP